MTRVAWILAALLGAGCGGTLAPLEGTLSEGPPPPQPAAVPGVTCGTPAPGYLATPESASAQVVAHDVAVAVALAPATEVGATYDAALVIEVDGSAAELLLALESGVDVVGLGLDRDPNDPYEPIEALDCQRGQLPAFHYVRVVFAEPLDAGTHTVRLRARVPAELALDQPMELGAAEGVLAASIGAEGAWLAHGWLPLDLSGAPSQVSLTVDAPDEVSVIASGEPSDGGWQVPPLRAGVTPLLVALPDTRMPLPQIVGDRTVRDTAAFGGLVAALEPALGTSFGTQTLAVVSPPRGGVFASVGGLTLIDSAAWGADEGPSRVFDGLARQVLQNQAVVDARLVDALTRYLVLRADGLDATSRDDLLAIYTSALDALPRRPESGEGDLAFAEVTLLDAFYVPVVYGKAPLAFELIERTVGRQIFDGVLSDAVAAAVVGSKGRLDSVAFEGALLAAAPDAAALVARLFRETGTIEVEAACRRGELRVRRRHALESPLAIAVRVGDATRELRFEAGVERIEEPVERCDGEIAAPGQLVTLETR